MSGIAFGFNVISPEEESESDAAELLASHHPGANEMDAYERVLGDAMGGDATLFAREDYVEEAWIVDPVLKADTPVYEYEPKTWGPKEVAAVTPPGGWQNPVLTGQHLLKECSSCPRPNDLFIRELQRQHVHDHRQRKMSTEQQRAPDAT